MSKEIKRNQNKYNELNVPYENRDIANEMLHKFWDEIDELRTKYKVPDVVIVVKASCNCGDEHPDIGEFIHVMSYGNSLNQEPMLAYAFGTAQAERRAMINKILAHKAD